MFQRGKVYRRGDLQDEYGGQAQGGISTPAGQGFVMLFTGGTGEQYGYRDSWTDDGLFFYTGEGQRGDMSFVRGNRAIRDHLLDGRDLHVFEYVSKGQVRYVGPMICTGFHESRSADLDGNDRRIIVFELAPAEQFERADAFSQDGAEGKLWQMPLSALRQRAVTAAAQASTAAQRLILAYSRSLTIRVYALRRADGVCEGCGRDAPFRTNLGRPYLEAHHIRRLSDGGPDEPWSVAGLCPNCHRRAHYGEDASEFNARLLHVTGEREKLSERM